MTATQLKVQDLTDCTPTTQLNYLKDKFPTLSVQLTYKGVEKKWGYYKDRYAVKVLYKGGSFTASYWQGQNYNREDENKNKVRLSALSCLLSDASAYEYTALEDFQAEFGYETYEKAEKVYNACKRTYDKLRNLFSVEQLHKLQEILNEWGY